MLTAPQSTHARVTIFKRSSITAEFDPKTRACWLFMHAEPRPCFSEKLLTEALELHAKIKSGEIEIDFYVIASASKDVFNLGGDLDLFRSCILDGQRDRLVEYGQRCIDLLNDVVSGFGRNVITVSVVDGEAKGGGFELALAADFMIAKEDAKFGFPEVLFNLFPGMGAYSFLGRKAGPQKAQQMILSGDTYTGGLLREMGIVDYSIVEGHAIHDAERFVRETSRRVGGFKAFLGARRLASFWPSRDELSKIVMAWVDCAMRVSERDLKLMGKIVQAQKRLS